MAAHHEDDLPTLEPADLAGVTGGAGFDMMTMLPLLIMRNRAQSAAQPPPQPATWTPKVTLNGVEQQPTSSPDGGTTFTSSV